jgi:hypothetical protein
MNGEINTVKAPFKICFEVLMVVVVVVQIVVFRVLTPCSLVGRY